MAVPLQLSPAPLRSPVFDRQGTMTQEWQRYFMQLFAVSANVGGVVAGQTTAIATLEGVQTGSIFDGNNTPQDARAIAEEAATRVPSDTPRDFAPAIEEVLRRSQTDAPKDFGPAIQEALLQAQPDSVRDFTPAIQAAEQEAIQQSLPDTARDFAPAIQDAAGLLLTDARTPQVTRADLDDLKALLAGADVPAPLANLGSAAYQPTTAFDAAGAADEIGRQQAQQLFKDFGPDIEAAIRLMLMEAQAQQVTRADLDDLRAQLAGADVPAPLANLGSAAYQPTTAFDSAGAADQATRLAAQDASTPQVTRADLDELRLQLTAVADARPQVTLADLDEMRALVAALDPPRASGFENWQTWTPAFSCSGSMTFALANISYANFLRIGGAVFFAIQVNFTLGGTASTAVYASLPYPPIGTGNYSVNANIVNGGTAPWIPSFAFADVTNNRLNVATPTGASWTLGGAWFSCQGFYQTK